MAKRSEIESLRDQRLRLLARCEIYRSEMSREVDNLRVVVGWVEHGYAAVRMLRSFWPILAAAAGIFTARKGPAAFGSLGKIWSVWRIGRKLLALWRRRPEPAPSPDRSQA